MESNEKVYPKLRVGPQTLPNQLSTMYHIVSPDVARTFNWLYLERRS